MIERLVNPHQGLDPSFVAALEDVFKQMMPHEMGFDYIGMSYQEQKSREEIPPSVIFGFSILFVFLILAALYESWTVPFSVLLSTPVAVFDALATLWLRRLVLGLLEPAYMVQMENDVPSCQCSSQSAAIVAKEFSLATCSALFSTFRSAIGSVPVANSFLASLWRSLASASDTAGYLPKAMSFSLPAKRYPNATACRQIE